jgi:hypothetical protein
MNENGISLARIPRMVPYLRCNGSDYPIGYNMLSGI